MSRRKIKNREFRLCRFCDREWPKLAMRTMPGRLRPETDSEREETMFLQEAGYWTPKKAFYDERRRRVQICDECFAKAREKVAEEMKAAGDE